jgi:hypothetical protein
MGQDPVTVEKLIGKANTKNPSQTCYLEVDLSLCVDEIYFITPTTLELPFEIHLANGISDLIYTVHLHVILADFRELKFLNPPKVGFDVHHQ